MFEKKEKVNSINKKLNILKKKYCIENNIFMFIDIYVSIIMGLGILSGFFFKPENSTFAYFIAFFIPIMLSLISTKIFSVIKYKVNSEEKKIFHKYDVYYNREFHDFISENKSIFEVFKNEDYNIFEHKVDNKDLFLIHFLKLIKKSNKKEIMELQSKIEMYLKNDLDENNNELKIKIVDLIDSKINKKEKVDEIEEKLNTVFSKEEKKKSIIKSI